MPARVSNERAGARSLRSGGLATTALRGASQLDMPAPAGRDFASRPGVARRCGACGAWWGRAVAAWDGVTSVVSLMSGPTTRTSGRHTARLGR